MVVLVSAPVVWRFNLQSDWDGCLEVVDGKVEKKWHKRRFGARVLCRCHLKGESAAVMCYKLRQYEWRANVNIANRAIITGWRSTAKATAATASPFCPRMSGWLCDLLLALKKKKSLFEIISTQRTTSAVAVKYKFIKIGSKNNNRTGLFALLICRMPIALWNVFREVVAYWEKNASFAHSAQKVKEKICVWRDDRLKCSRAGKIKKTTTTRTMRMMRQLWWGTDGRLQSETFRKNQAALKQMPASESVKWCK